MGRKEQIRKRKEKEGPKSLLAVSFLFEADEEAIDRLAAAPDVKVEIRIGFLQIRGDLFAILL